MIKMMADTNTNPQQSGIGIALMTGCGAGGAIFTGAVGGATGVAVAVIRG